MIGCWPREKDATKNIQHHGVPGHFHPLSLLQLGQEAWNGDTFIPRQRSRSPTFFPSVASGNDSSITFLDPTYSGRHVAPIWGSYLENEVNVRMPKLTSWKIQLNYTRICTWWVKAKALKKKQQTTVMIYSWTSDINTSSSWFTCLY